MVTVALAGIIAAAIWLLVFDMWLGQVERQYLWENARHEMKLGPPVSLKAMMDDGRTTGARVATAWSALVGGAILLAGRYAYRLKGRTRLEPIMDSLTYDWNVIGQPAGATSNQPG